MPKNATPPAETLDLQDTKAPIVPAASTSEISIPQLLKLAVESPDAEKKIDVMERLIAMQERHEEKLAQKEFAKAFHALQQEMTGVQALDEVPDKQGNVRYTFASYERIMAQVRPILLKHGFSVSFDSEFKENRLVMRCKLTHVSGHSETTTQYMRVAAIYGANDAQNDGGTTTMARRYALCCALNITITRDTDGNMPDAANEGQPLTHEQAATLREMVKEAKADEKRFLAYAQAKTYEEIGSARYAQLFRELQDRINNK